MLNFSKPDYLHWITLDTSSFIHHQQTNPEPVQQLPIAYGLSHPISSLNACCRRRTINVWNVSQVPILIIFPQIYKMLGHENQFMKIDIDIEVLPPPWSKIINSTDFYCILVKSYSYCKRCCKILSLYMMRF